MKLEGNVLICDLAELEGKYYELSGVGKSNKSGYNFKDEISNEVMRLMIEDPNVIKDIKDLKDLKKDIEVEEESSISLKIENVVEVESEDYEDILDTQLTVVGLMKEVMDELYIPRLTPSELYSLLIKSDLELDDGEILLIMSDYIEDGMFDTDDLNDLTNELGVA